MESRRVRRRGRRRRGGLLVLLRARRRFVRVARVHALRDALRVRALEADGRGSFQHEVGEAHRYRDIGVEVFAVAKDTLWSMSGQFLERLIPVFATLAREARDCGGANGTYRRLGRDEEALPIYREVYSGTLKLRGKDDSSTLIAVNNYALCLMTLESFEEAETLLSKILLVARRAVGESTEITLKMRFNYARALYLDTEATLDDLREAVATLGETAQVARRVLGCAHPFTEGIDLALEHARAVHDAREMPSPGTA